MLARESRTKMPITLTSLRPAAPAQWGPATERREALPLKRVGVFHYYTGLDIPYIKWDSAWTQKLLLFLGD